MFYLASFRFLCIVLIAIALPSIAHSAEKSAGKNIQERQIVIHAGRLLAVPGQPVETDKSIVIQGNRIIAVHDGFIVPDTLDADRQPRIIDLRNHFVLPGLMDAHIHIGWSSKDLPPKKSEEMTDADLTLWMLRHARTALSAGFTTVRDMASPPFVIFSVRDWIDGGKLLGPRNLAAGLPVTAVGGHGDMSKPGLDSSDVMASGLCQGVESCRRAVRMQHKIGADVIKLMSTGGFHDHTGTDKLFFYDEIEATIKAAHQLGMAVATHAYANDAIADAVRAGVDSVEHGFGASDKTLREMRKKGIYLVPTLSVAQRKGSEIRKYREQHGAFERALKIGTPIAFGTDVGGIPHRYAARELAYMVAAGMEPAAAIRSATVETAKLFRIEDEAGTIETGKLADLIAVTEDPLEDIAALEEIDFVMKAGRIAKQDGQLSIFFLD
jgi:imidazolonepropionase-like amidohydrolase